MRQKFICIFLSAIMVAGLTGCSNDASQTNEVGTESSIAPLESQAQEAETETETETTSEIEVQTEQASDEWENRFGQPLQFIEFNDQMIDGFKTDADTSVIDTYMDEYTYKGDYAEIMKEYGGSIDSKLYGLWYDPELGETLFLTTKGAEVYIPYLDENGVTKDTEYGYQYELIDRTDRGKCPELAIYFMGMETGPLAYYLGGITDNLMWTYDKSQIFYRQEIPEQ